MILIAQDTSAAAAGIVASAPRRSADAAFRDALDQIGSDIAQELAEGETSATGHAERPINGKDVVDEAAGSVPREVAETENTGALVHIENPIPDPPVSDPSERLTVAEADDSEFFEFQEEPYAVISDRVAQKTDPGATDLIGLVADADRPILTEEGTSENSKAFSPFIKDATDAGTLGTPLSQTIGAQFDIDPEGNPASAHLAFQAGVAQSVGAGPVSIAATGMEPASGPVVAGSSPREGAVFDGAHRLVPIGNAAISSGDAGPIDPVETLRPELARVAPARPDGGTAAMPQVSGPVSVFLPSLPDPTAAQVPFTDQSVLTGDEKLAPLIGPDGSSTRAAGTLDGLTQRPAIQTLPQATSQQIAQATETIRLQGGGTIEVSLSPEELGNVRITMHRNEAGYQIAIVADRDDTLNLLRRHADTLDAAFRDLDLGQTDISFGQGGGDRKSDPSPTESSVYAVDERIGQIVQIGHLNRLASGGTARLDLKL